MSTTEEGGGGERWCGDWLALYLLVVDHEVDEDGIVGGAHEVGKEAGVGGFGSQHI